MILRLYTEKSILIQNIDRQFNDILLRKVKLMKKDKCKYN